MLPMRPKQQDNINRNQAKEARTWNCHVLVVFVTFKCHYEGIIILIVA